MEKVMVAVLGRDRPGIVCKVSSILAENGCNIEDISQTVLQGEFCGMFVVSLAKGLSLTDIQHVLIDGLGSENIIAYAKSLDTEEVHETISSEPFVVVSIGEDRVGLIAAVSCIMYEFGVNITNLRFINRTPAFPNKTLTIYEVDVPKGVNLGQFTDKLRHKATELGLDITVQHKKIFEEICRI
ncbi:amino acid-binding protein [Desulfothermus okinawensis JCM 13304]